MQELDGDVAVILRDLVDFLECLGDVELSEVAQIARETLLSRSRAILQQSLKVSNSPEPYLDMNAGKSLLVLTGEEAEQPPEYVGADEGQPKRGSLQHYYETFQDFRGDSGKGKLDGKIEGYKSMDDLVLLYAGFSAAQAKDRSAKSGTLLYLRRERRMFAPFKVFWFNRWCWVSLVGSHLLIYLNERENRPYLVVSLRGYKSRPIPVNAACNPRQSEGAFEIYCPGDRTFQFVAKGNKDMKEWVDAISENFKLEDGSRTKNRAATFVEILELESNERMCIERVKEEKEKYQDVLNSPKTKEKKAAQGVTYEKDKVDSKEEAPPLPARTRRLPSLPSQEKILYENKEEPYDEEGLYHRIEDVKAQRDYQNCQINSDGSIKRENAVASADFVQETYDEVEDISDRLKEMSKEPLETYDDIQSIAKDKDESISYDDIQTVVDNRETKPEKDKSLKAQKSSQKRSFLYRVCNRKESMKKDEKKAKSPTPSTSSTAPAISTIMDSERTELPCYDDISNLATNGTCNASSPGTNEEDYQSPPAPRPIYSRPPTIIKCAVPEEIYDDIGSCIEANSNNCKSCANIDTTKDYPKHAALLSDHQPNADQEYYQVPKSNNRKVDEYQEELYDDVALSETFKSRPRDSAVLCPSPEKSVWCRFGSGKRPRIFDHVIRQTSCNESNDTVDENAPDHQNTKIISFQKFISKMENTLGKATKANGLTQT